MLIKQFKNIIMISISLFSILIIGLSMIYLKKNKISKNDYLNNSNTNNLNRVIKYDNIEIYSALVDNLKLPLIIYKNVFKNSTKEQILEHLKNNKWSSNLWEWNSGVGTIPHYHDNCHETLIVTNGTAHVRWGKNKQIYAVVQKGDVIFQPAGCFHVGTKCIDCSTMGVYPDNAEHWKFEYNEPTSTQIKKINDVPAPNDPIFGKSIKLFIN